MANLFSSFKTVTRKDYFGNEYVTSILDDKRRDLGELWQSFMQVQRENARDLRIGSVSQSWCDREIIKEQIKNESI